MISVFKSFYIHYETFKIDWKLPDLMVGDGFWLTQNAI